MSTTTDYDTQPHRSQPSPKNIQKTFWTNSQGDTRLDSLAAINDCLQGALLRSLVDEAFTEQFDDLDLAHIEQGRVSVEYLQALANDELTVDELELETGATEPVTEHERIHTISQLLPMTSLNRDLHLTGKPCVMPSRIRRMAGTGMMTSKSTRAELPTQR